MPLRHHGDQVDCRLCFRSNRAVVLPVQESGELVALAPICPGIQITQVETPKIHHSERRKLFDVTDSKSEDLSAAIKQLQIDRNQKNRDAPEDAAHRDRITQLLQDIATADESRGSTAVRSLLVLGAGNCRDINLARLLSTFERISLVDIDVEAVQLACSGYPEFTGRLQIFAPVDIGWPLLQQPPRNSSGNSGINTTTDEYSEGHGSDNTKLSPGHPELSPGHPSMFLRSLASVSWPYQIPRASVVVSSCLLSQLIEAMSSVAAPDAPEYSAALQALRIGHLRRMINQCLPGGSVLLITDVISSDTAPELKQAGIGDLKQLLRESLAERNYFSGCHPDRVIADLQILAAATGRISRIRVHDPWTWRLAQRVFAVYAIQAELRREPADAVTGD